MRRFIDSTGLFGSGVPAEAPVAVAPPTPTPAAAVPVAAPTQAQDIRLYRGPWESLSLNNAIAKLIIEEGYGYPVEMIEMSTVQMQDSLPVGKLDVNMELWQQNIPEWYNQQVRNGTIANLGMTYEGGPQFWMIPQ